MRTLTVSAAVMILPLIWNWTELSLVRRLGWQFTVVLRILFIYKINVLLRFILVSFSGILWKLGKNRIDLKIFVLRSMRKWVFVMWNSILQCKGFRLVCTLYCLLLRYTGVYKYYNQTETLKFLTTEETSGSWTMDAADLSAVQPGWKG